MNMSFFLCKINSNVVKHFADTTDSVTVMVEIGANECH